MGVCPWLSELMEYDWDMDETLVSVIMVAMVTVAGHLAINRMKAAIAELRNEKIERKNSKKRGANKASSLFFFVRERAVGA